MLHTIDLLACNAHTSGCWLFTGSRAHWCGVLRNNNVLAAVDFAVPGQSLCKLPEDDYDDGANGAKWLSDQLGEANGAACFEGALNPHAVVHPLGSYVCLNWNKSFPRVSAHRTS